MFSALGNLFSALVRSGKWRTVRIRHLAKEPLCQACLSDAGLEVHHILPVHAGGDELSPENLITMCHHCHFCVGHACNWTRWRPEVVSLAAALRKSVVAGH